MSSHQDLEAWRSAIDLVDMVYDLAKQLPTDERFGLISQMQRAVVSVPANIAEGCGRDSTKDFLRHLSIARGSLAEVSTFLVIIRRRGFATSLEMDEINAQLDKVGRLTAGLRRSLRSKLDA